MMMPLDLLLQAAPAELSTTGVPLWAVGVAASPFITASIALWKRNNKLEDGRRNDAVMLQRETLEVLNGLKGALQEESRSIQAVLNAMAR